MTIDRRKRLLLFLSAAALRLLLLLCFPSLPPLLTSRVEISTPVTSYKRLREGLFLYTHNVSPYDGGVFHQAPLLLPLFALIPSGVFDLATGAVYIVLDVVCAGLLMGIAESGVAVRGRRFVSPREGVRWGSVAIGAAYLFNPFTIATCLGRPTSVFTNCAILSAVSAAASGKPLSAMLGLGLAAYLSIYPALLLPPVLILCYDQQAMVLAEKKMQLPSVPGFVGKHISIFGAGVGWLLYVSSVLTGGSWEFLRSTYGVQLLLPDLTPNVGLWWYFFIEMFDSFREFFLGVFWLHLASYVGGLCIRIRKQPLFVITTLLGIFAIFKPYPSVSDTSLYFAMLPLYRHIYPLMRYTFFATSAVLYATLLGPAFYYLWIYAGSGNANFFYAITLVWSLGLTVILTDSLFAVLRDELEVERPEVAGKDIRTI